MEFDTLIANGEIVDGTDRLRYAADVGISGDRIAAIGDLEEAVADRVIDASGQIVAPGTRTGLCWTTRAARARSIRGLLPRWSGIAASLPILWA